MKSFVGYGYLQRLRVIGHRDGQTTPKRLSYVNVKANSGVFAFGPVKCNIIDSNKMTNMLEKLFQGFFFPQFKG